MRKRRHKAKQSGRAVSDKVIALVVTSPGEVGFTGPVN